MKPTTAFLSIAFLAAFMLLQFSAKAQITFANPMGGDIWERGKTYTIEWDVTGPVPDTMRLVFDYDSGSIAFSSILGDIPSSQGSYTLALAATGQTGTHFRIRATTPDFDETLLGMTDKFTVVAASTVSIEQNTSGSLPSIRLASNANPELMLNFPKAGPATIDVYDLNGRVLAHRQWLTISQGATSFGLPASSSGLYICRLQTAEGVITQKFYIKP